MLIDSHMHIHSSRWYPDHAKWLHAVAEARSTYPFRDPHELLPKYQKMWEDADGRKWSDQYQRLGIDIAVNFPNDFGMAWGEEAAVSVEEMNRSYCELAKKYPGRFYSFIGVDPRRHNAVELLEKGVKEWGAKGLKLLPHTGFYPNDRICYRLYEKCVELGVPVAIHTGYGMALPMKYASPVHLDEPAQDFPELEFIAAHAGCGIGHQWQEMAVVAKFNPNISLDLAEVEATVIKGGYRESKGKYKDHIPAFLDMLDIWRNMLPGGCLNILWATDYPYPSFAGFPLDLIKGWVELFNNLPAVAAEYGYDFSQAEADNMRYKNAARIMKLDLKVGIK
ncbi:MAG: amidohydrolase family protein [Chloroflexi bacterium]|nr:amidohydrolase family protein [Chloroflexota bacterium]